MALFSLILDGLILIFLAVTIFYAARLSLQLKTFKNNRKAMEKLLETLTENIDQAERSVAGLQGTAGATGRDLQDHVDEARNLLDELQLMQQSGNNLADRLEKLADRNSRTDQSAPLDDFSFEEEGAQAGSEDDDSDTPFFIRDPEFGREDGYEEQGLISPEHDSVGGFQSRAERDLYEALQAHHGKTGGRA